MKKLLVFLFGFLSLSICQAKFKSDYITATGSATIQGPMTATGTLTMGGILTNLNGTYAETQTSAVPFAAFTIGSVANYTLAQATGGLGGQEWYTNNDGRYMWTFHSNQSNLATGAASYTTGLHGPDQVGLFVVADSTNANPIHIFHATSVSTAPIIWIDLETNWQNNLYPTTAPSQYSGTFNGNAIQLWKRGIPQFVVDSSGTITTYDTLGTSNFKMWHNTSSAILQTNNSKNIGFLANSGAVDFYSASLTQLLDVLVDSGGSATFNATGSTITVGGSATTDVVAMGGMMRMFKNAAPRTNLIPTTSGLEVANTGQTPFEVCVSTAGLDTVSAAAAKLSWALITNRSTACSN